MVDLVRVPALEAGRILGRDGEIISHTGRKARDGVDSDITEGDRRAVGARARPEIDLVAR